MHHLPSIGEIVARWFDPIDVDPDWGLLLAIVLLVVGYFRWLYKRDSPSEYSLVVEAARWNVLYRLSADVNPSFHMMFNDKEIADLFSVTLYLTNDGRKCLNEDKFYEDVLVTFAKPKHFLNLNVASSSKYARIQKVKYTNDELIIRVLNLDASCTLKLTLLFERTGETLPIDEVSYHLRENAHPRHWSAGSYVESSVLRYNGAEMVWMFISGAYLLVAIFILYIGLRYNGTFYKLPLAWKCLVVGIPLIAAGVTVGRIFNPQPERNMERAVWQWHAIRVE